MEEFVKNQEVYIRDFPYGKPTRIKGIIVACLRKNVFNIKLLNGLDEGKIKMYYDYRISSVSYEDYIEEVEKSGV